MTTAPIRRDEVAAATQTTRPAGLSGMLRTLDPHSVLLSPEAFHDMQIQTSGHFGGLGIVISIRDGLLTIMNPMPNTPASRAGPSQDRHPRGPSDR